MVLLECYNYCLGNPNFMCLEKKFPPLFNKNPKFLHCEVCKISKHSKNTYPVHPYKPSFPFSLIHNDMWGPSRVSNVTGSR